MPNDRPLKILVIGCGSIGRRHIRLLKEMGANVYGCDTSLEAREYAHATLEVPAPFANVQEAWASYMDWDGAIIATPNHLHHEAAQEALLNDLPILIEKPIAHTMAAAQSIALYTHIADGTILVGYSLRFHPGLRQLKELLDQGLIGTIRHASIHFGSYLPDWRPGFDYRQGYAAHRKIGGGILLDASHELDYACWLFGRPVSVMAQMQNSGALAIETEDIADVVIRFESGMQANVHLDYLSRTYRRGCVITGDAGTLTWEFPMDKPLDYLAGEPQMERDVRHAFRYPKPVEPDQMYRTELRHFLSMLRGEEQPLVTGEDGIRALRLVEAAKRSAEEGRVIRF